MKVIVTCGPSFEPIDEVRRLTNFSTGELGALLAEQLGAAGHEVFCLKGSGATHPGPAPGPGCLVRRFDTNDDLLALLREISSAHGIGAVFHAAALCDYRVAAVRDDAGNACQSAKIASRSGALTLHLEPATKVIHELRDGTHRLICGRDGILNGCAIIRHSSPEFLCKSDRFICDFLTALRRSANIA